MPADLSTRWLGLSLPSPIVPGASPWTRTLEQARALEAAGAGAIVMESLFEEQISYEREELLERLSAGTESFGEATTYFPALREALIDGEEYIERVAATKRALRIPVVGSLNGATPGGWVRYARRIEEAGADALELNVYVVAADPSETAAEVEERYVEIVRSVRAQIRIPLAVKIGPYFSSLPCMARRLVEAGADGLTLFNRFYQPTIDLAHMRVVPEISLSASADLLLPLRWTAILHGRLRAGLATSGGVRTAEDVAKALLAGADVAQVASVLSDRGPERLRGMLDGLRAWMEAREHASIEPIRGMMSQRNVEDPASFERATYISGVKAFR